MVPQRSRKEQCRPERRSARSINVYERTDEPWRLPAEVMCRVQREKTWYSGKREVYTVAVPGPKWKSWMKRLLALLAPTSCTTVLGQQSSAKSEALEALRHAGTAFDIRQRAGSLTTSQSPLLQSQFEGRQTALENYVASQGGGLRYSLNRFGLPRSISRSEAPLSLAYDGDNLSAAKAYLSAHSALFQLSGEEIQGLRLARNVEKGELAFLSLSQTVGEIDVFHRQVRVVLRSGRVVEAGVDDVIPGLTLDTQPSLNAAEAMAAAYASLGLETAELIPVSSPVNRRLMFRNPWGGHSPIAAELSVFPMTTRSARLAYRVYLSDIDHRWYEILVDAHSGQLLFRQELTRQMGQARVWTSSPLAGDRELVDFPDGWLPPNGTVTSGNNVDAFLDRDGDGEPDPDDLPGVVNGRAFSATQMFDFPAETGQDPRDFPAASVTNLFYSANRAHDYYYGLGFNEAAGNMQADNFGQGGIGNDRLVAQAQDANASIAFIATLPGGLSPVMNMGILRGESFFSSDDDIDSSFSTDTVIHEYGHAVTNRVIGGPDHVTCLQGLQSAALGEGWSDFFAASFSDDPVVGEFLNGDTVRGIRRESYEGYSITYQETGNEGFDVHNNGEI